MAQNDQVTVQKFIEDMTADEQIAEIHAILGAATTALADMSENKMLKAMRFPPVSAERFAEDDLADSLAKLRQLSAVLDAVGNNPMLSGLAKNMIGA